jgi:ribosomal protein L11 methyltransferase
VNAERNGVQDRYFALVPDKISTDVIADIVVANLFENALVDLTHQLTELTAQSGWLALSGILTSQAERVKIHYADSFDFSLRCEGEWALLVARRKTQ